MTLVRMYESGQCRPINASKFSVVTKISDLIVIYTYLFGYLQELTWHCCLLPKLYTSHQRVIKSMTGWRGASLQKEALPKAEHSH